MFLTIYGVEKSQCDRSKCCCNLVPRASVAFPQKASRPADTPGKRRPDLDKFSLAQTDVLRPLKLARSRRAGSVEELTV